MGSQDQHRDYAWTYPNLCPHCGAPGTSTSAPGEDVLHADCVHQAGCAWAAKFIGDDGEEIQVLEKNERRRKAGVITHYPYREGA